MAKPSNSADVESSAWKGFLDGPWSTHIDVRDFIQRNYIPYTGDNEFLENATPATIELWSRVSSKIIEENNRHGPLDFDNEVVASITSHSAGYIDQSLEKIVGLQTDQPFKRALLPNGGIRIVESACNTYGKPLDGNIRTIFSEYRKTHNQGVFDVYPASVRLCRKSGIITGLPDAYGRGRIIGDYRRVALYGVDRLQADKRNQHVSLDADLANGKHLNEIIQLREEIAEQARALTQMKVMAASYGFDISRPAKDAQQAIQWTYFAYLAAIKSQNGAAMSLGRITTFIDIYIERDLKNGLITEKEAQEIIDHFVMKLRMIRFLRTPDYDQLFSGDPVWATESIGGMGLDGRPLVTKTSFRFIHTLGTMGPSPEPNITVLWSQRLPDTFKRFCAEVSIQSSSIQYENDDLMREQLGSDDYGIACCVSPMVIGKQMQFFGARANLAKTLLYAINGGVDEQLNLQVAPLKPPIRSDTLVFDDVMQRLDQQMDWLAREYITALNCIHYMHDKYCYEAVQMALHDRDVYRTMACGIAGLSVTADSLSAIRFASVKPIRNETGLAIDFEVEGEYPAFGNNDPRADTIARDLVVLFMDKLRQQKAYRNSVPTQSILTITSNIVYGQKTGNTPDGRRKGQPFAPGANPMHGRDDHGALASLTSVAKLPFSSAQDGISYTFSIVPNALGPNSQARTTNLISLLDGYFYNDKKQEGGQHININVLNRETLIDAMDNPHLYPQLTIRVSGYAVRFNALTKEQQREVIARTFSESL